MCPDVSCKSILMIDAQVAGLRESLDMKGHDYNTVLSVTTAGSVTRGFPEDASRADSNN